MGSEGEEGERRRRRRRRKGSYNLRMKGAGREGGGLAERFNNYGFSRFVRFHLVVSHETLDVGNVLKGNAMKVIEF